MFLTAEETSSRNILLHYFSEQVKFNGFIVHILFNMMKILLRLFKCVPETMLAHLFITAEHQ